MHAFNHSLLDIKHGSKYVYSCVYDYKDRTIRMTICNREYKHHRKHQCLAPIRRRRPDLYGLGHHTVRWDPDFEPLPKEERTKELGKGKQTDISDGTIRRIEQEVRAQHEDETMEQVTQEPQERTTAEILRRLEGRRLDRRRRPVLPLASRSSRVRRPREPGCRPPSPAPQFRGGSSHRGDVQEESPRRDSTRAIPTTAGLAGTGVAPAAHLTASPVLPGPRLADRRGY